jgi:3-hydroxy-9,10-secoandrosta-1,3,5(10)-triene-9,17-dione monooxygenase reductase component
LTSDTRKVDVAVQPEVAIDPAVFRSVLGRFCTGLAIITANGPRGPLGFTCQSFASLSLDPPLITISPAKSSTTWPKIREVGRFCVNLLADEHESTSASFARSGGNKFDGVEWTLSPNGSPMLSGVIAWIDCAIAAEHAGGDHHIVVGAVEDLAVNASSTPLLYYRGKYVRLAD